MSTALAIPATTATERLEQSRTLLRQALQAKPGSRTASGARKPPPKWLDELKSIPLLTVLVEAIGSWWAQHPLRVASQLAVETTSAIVQPLAKRNPLGLVVGALVVGGILAWARPWRWILKPALFAGLWSQLLSKGIAHLPLESWLAALVSVPWQKPSAKTTSA